MEGSGSTRPAGGFATQRGINYQNRVAAYFAACCLAESIALPQIPSSPVESIRCETGDPIADILLSLESDGVVFVEVKRTVQITASRMKPVISQFVQQYLVSQQGTSGGKFPWRRVLDPSRDRFLLLTSSESPVNVTKHLSSCLARIGPETTAADLASIPQNNGQRRAFEDFHALAREAWKEVMGADPPLDKLVQLYSLMRIGSLDVNPGEGDEQRAETMLAAVVISNPEESSKSWATLVQLMSAASESRQRMTRGELRKALLAEGFGLVSSPTYIADIRALREYTRLSLASLDHLATLDVLGESVRIKRPVTASLRTRLAEGSLLVVGEPGAGKSGVLHELATELVDAAQDVVFLAADRLEDSLRSELGLQHEISDVLENWSGTDPGLLVIDALDAARGSKALTHLRDLIRRVVGASGSRWKVVASIRVFDLRYSQDLQSMFRRSRDEILPGDFQDRSFADLRHVAIPRFSPAELLDIRKQAPALDAVFKSATLVLAQLLSVPFNLRLVAEMLSSDLGGSDLSAIKTQVGLLNKYWLHRVIKSASEGTTREMVLVEVLHALVKARRLTVSKMQLRDTATTQGFSSLCSDNVLVEQIANLHGRNIIGFSHHLLFDYAASRLLIASSVDHFLESLVSERDLSLFLRPSIDLLFKEAWLKKRSAFWQMLRSFSADMKVPAVAKIIGPAVVPELAVTDDDLSPLVDALSSLDQTETDLAEQWLIHVIGAVLAGVSTSSLSLWSRFCYRIATLPSSLRVAAVCQSLIDYIVEKTKAEQTLSSEDAAYLGRAAVRLLDRFLQTTSRDGWLVGRAITNVMVLYWANPEESAVALRKLITPEEVRNRGAEQGHWIARNIKLLFHLDPQFVADTYIAFFGYQEESEEQTSMGGSRILALTSNRRQDYRQTQWQLAQFFPAYLESHFSLCTEVVLAIIHAFIEREHKPREPKQVIKYVLAAQEQTVTADYSAIWDPSSVRNEELDIANTYFRKLESLADSPQTTQEAIETVEALLTRAKYAYLLRKVLSLAKACASQMTRVVYPLLISESALLSIDISSLIGDVLSVGYGELNQTQRSNVESTILQLAKGADGDAAESVARSRDRLLGCIPRELLVLPESIVKRDELSSSGGAPENRPPFTWGGVYSSTYSSFDRLREEGVPIDVEPNASLYASADELWRFASKFSNTTPNSDDIAGLADQLVLVNQRLLQNDPAVHPSVRNTAEANLVAACAAAAKYKDLDCSCAVGALVKTILFAGLNSPIPEPHPESDSQFDRFPSWSTPLQRIEAAVGIGNLLWNRRCFGKELVEKSRSALSDPVPAVRFQIATRLLALHDRDLTSLWSMLHQLARNEKSTGVLSGALYAVLNPLAGRYKKETVDLLNVVLSRTNLPNEGGDSSEWCYRIAAGLYIWQGDAAAYALISPVIDGESFKPRRSSQCLEDIRGALTYSSDVPQDADSKIRQRAFSLMKRIVLTASSRIDFLINDVAVNDRSEQWHKDFNELAQLIDYIGNQLYFSSGAYDGATSDPKPDDNARRLFWEESRQVITLLSAVAIPSVAHHLIETLESFILFAPAEVFHAIANVVRSANNWGYQYESMAVDLLVKVTERYLAEFRMLLQQDMTCREELIDILDIFVNAGWPSARRLSYRLEEIFR